MSKIQVTFYPGIEKKYLDTGLMAEISWQRMSDDLDKIFRIKPTERLVGITISEYGIKAKIETM